MKDDELDRLLGALPHVGPSPDFADRVMARVTVPARAAVSTPLPIVRRPRVLLVAALAAIAVAMVASIAWSIAHEATLTSLSRWLSASASEWTLRGLREVASSVARWSPGGLRATRLSPSSLAIGSGLGSLLYVGSAFLFYRLMITPSSRAEYARH